MFFPTSLSLLSLCAVSTLTVLAAPQTNPHAVKHVMSSTEATTPKQAPPNLADLLPPSLSTKNVCTPCFAKDGCTRAGHTLVAQVYAVENNFVWQVGEDGGHFAVKLDLAKKTRKTKKTMGAGKHRKTFSIINGLKDPEANLFQIVTLDTDVKTQKPRMHSHWTQVDQGTTCLQANGAALKKDWPEYISLVNVWKKGVGASKVTPKAGTI